MGRYNAGRLAAQVEGLAVKYFGGWEVPPSTPAAQPPSGETLDEPVAGLRPQGRPALMERDSPAGPIVLKAFYRPGMASQDALVLDVIGYCLPPPMQH